MMDGPWATWIRGSVIAAVGWWTLCCQLIGLIVLTITLSTAPLTRTTVTLTYFTVLTNIITVTLSCGAVVTSRSLSTPILIEDKTLDW